ncbi:MAG: serine/threonine-protein kinase [bacterium]|nr:serine/threonine-protein kinase [bacterium]
MRAGIKARLFADADDTEAALRVGHGTAPNRIGRYVVIKRIGAGGMGVVYAAYDDKLDRKVAVKLLRPGRGPVSETARQRLLREAQAIARLPHRCVVQVYEVGTYDDEVFIAMEYVEGSTLKQWQPSRDWRDILARYVDAGRGLCAAHAAGIVHRDFKADNVLVRASDLAVRVVDFGLARTERQDVLGDTAGEVAPDAEDTSLTRTGLIMGTPAYMAPEQHLASATDARTDQFSFCASLFEALYGYRAFAGERLDELRANVLAGKVEPAPRYTAVPEHIHRTLARGLAVDPAQRHPTMEALLEQLELSKPSRPWRRISWTLGLTAALVGGSVSWSSAMTPALSPAAVRLRAAFDDTLRGDATQELTRLQARTMPQRWNDLVLSYASAAPDPTARLAALKHLAFDAPAAMPAARSHASGALRGGPVFAIHTTASAVRSVEFSPRGEQLVALTERGAVLYWPAPGAARAEVLHDDVIDVAFGEDGTLEALLPQGRLATLDTEGETLEVRSVHGGELTQVASDARGRVAVGAEDGSVLLLHEGSITALREHDASIAALAFHPTKPTLASGDDSGRVNLWFLGRDTHRSTGVEGGVSSLVWMREGEVVVAETAHGTMAWDGEQGTPVASPAAGRVRSVAATPDGSVVLERMSDGVVAVLGDGSRLRLDRSEGSTVLAVSADGRWGASGHAQSVSVWRTGVDVDGVGPRGERLFHLEGDAPGVGVHARGDQVVAVTANGSLWSLRPWRGERIADVNAAVRSSAQSFDGRTIAIETASGAIELVDLDDPTSSRTLERFGEGRAGPIAWSADGSVIAKLQCDDARACEVSVHPTDGAAPRGAGPLPPETLHMHVSESGSSVALAQPDHLMLWDTSTGVLRRFSPPSGMRPVACAFGPGGTLRWASASEGSLEVLQLDDDGTNTLFEHDGLGRLASVTTGDGLVLEVPGEGAVLWQLSEDSFTRLPGDVLAGLDRPEVHVMPGGMRLWVAEEGAATVTVHDLSSGWAERLPRPRRPLAWPRTSLWVEIAGPQLLREWGAAAPHDAEAFGRWLRSRTRVVLPVSALKRTVPHSAEPL